MSKRVTDTLIKTFSIATLGLLSSSAWANCERSDIEFYLSKGFTPDQITSLCNTHKTAPSKSTEATQSNTNATMGQAVTQQPIQVTNRTTSQAELLRTIEDNLKIKQVKISSGVLSFIQNPKIDYGRKTFSGDYRQIAPDILVSIPMQNYRVINVNAGIPLIKDPYAKLGNVIKLELTQNLSSFQKNQATAIKKYLEEQSKQNILLRFKRNANVDETAYSLRQLAQK